MNRKLRISIAAILFGIGLAFGALPIIVASLIVKRNLFIESINLMDVVWKESLTSSSITQQR